MTHYQQVDMRLVLRPMSRQTGFTLLELSITLMILALIISSIMSVLLQNTRRAKMDSLNMKLDAIESKLQSFRMLNGRLPCPADLTLAVTDQYFGLEGVSTGACTTGSTYNDKTRTVAAAPGPTANFYNAAYSYSYVVAGMVPTKTLGLPDEYAIDPWGGRLTYVIDNRVTAASAFTTYKARDSYIGNIIVRDINNATRTTNAILMIISHGPNGHGAYQLSGARKSAGSINTREEHNCHCDSSAASETFDNNFFQTAASTSTTPLDVYDDITRYYLRSQFLSVTEVTTPP